MERSLSSENAVIEQVPHYTLTTLDDGSFEKLRLIVELPGVESSAGLHVGIEGNRAFVHLPGKYRLDLPLGVTVADTALTLKFVKNRQYLKAEYKVLERSTPAQSAAAQRTNPTRTPSPPSTHTHSSDAFSPRAVPNGVHVSFMADAVKLRDAWRSTAQGPKSHHGAGASKQSGRARPPARSGGATPGEEPSLNEHKPPQQQANGWQRGFLNQAFSGNGKADDSDSGAAAAGDSFQGAAPDGGRAESSGDSSSEQWEPTSHCAAHQEEAQPGLDRHADADSNLYEAAKLQSNREAAAECISKAEEALAGADFDKAERLFQKAEQLAPDMFADVSQTLEQEKTAHEADKAAKKKEQREAAKRKKREEDRRKKEEEQRRQEEEQQQKKQQEERRRELEEEQKRRADVARAAAAEEAARRQGRTSYSGETDDDEDPIYEEDYNWGYLSFSGRFGFYSKMTMMILYTVICYATIKLGAPGLVQWAQRRRFGSRRQRATVGCMVLAAWALAIYSVFRYGLFWLRCIWGLWCLVFWRPPVTSAIVETCLLGLLCCVMPGFTSLLAVPIMWHWVGGGFAAVHGTVAAILFIVHVDDWLEGTPPITQRFSFLYKLAGPVVYTGLAVSMRGWLLLLVFAGVDFCVYRAFKSSGRARGDTGMVAGSESCRPEAVPKGAAPEVAKVLQAASWYAVLDVAPSASVEEIRKAHKVKSLVTHPDKLGTQNSGAHEASVRVNTARDVLADVQKRAAYDAELRASAAAAVRSASQPQSPPGNGSGGAPGFFTEFSGRREPCGRATEHDRSCVCMPCKACSQWHHVYITDRHRSAAYWCNSCNRLHAGINKHVWKETTSAGFFSASTTRVYLYALGLTLDITDITDSCDFWSWLARKATGPSCRSALQFQGELPIREDCFAAYRQQEAPPDPRRSNNKRKGGRRRR